MPTTTPPEWTPLVGGHRFTPAVRNSEDGPCTYSVNGEVCGHTYVEHRPVTPRR